MGFQSSTVWPSTIHNKLGNIQLENTSALAYADDTQWIAPSQAQAQRIVDISNEFFELNDIMINGSKTEILTINPEIPNYEDRHIFMGRDRTKILPLKKTEPMRILGVWYTEQGENAHIRSSVTNEIKNFARLFRYKRINISQLTYINNTVLLPRLEYRMKCTIWSDQTYLTLHRPIYTVAKHKIGLARTAHNNILEHPGLINMKSLWKNQLAALTTEFIVLLNTPLKAQRLVEARLRAAQIQLNITECILEVDSKYIVPYHLRNNFSYEVLRKCKDYLIDIKVSQHILSE